MLNRFTSTLHIVRGNFSTANMDGKGRDLGWVQKPVQEKWQNWVFYQDVSCAIRIEQNPTQLSKITSLRDGLDKGTEIKQKQTNKKGRKRIRPCPKELKKDKKCFSTSESLNIVASAFQVIPDGAWLQTHPSL